MDHWKLVRFTSAVVSMLAVMVPAAAALDIVTRDDLVANTVKKVDLVRRAENFVVLFDASGSMGAPYGNTGASRLEAAKRILRQQLAVLPDLGYSAGLYTFTPFKTYYALDPLRKADYMQAIANLPTAETAGNYKGQPTPLADGILALDAILSQVQGRCAVFIFTDGTYTLTRPQKTRPLDAVREIAARHNVCFYFISSANTPQGEKLVDEMAAVNACSRVIPFDAMYANPVYAAGALYVVKSTAEIETVMEKRISATLVDDAQFDFDSDRLRPEDIDGLEKLGTFLQENPRTFAVLAGYTDNTGSAAYNMALSWRRVKRVRDFLTVNYGIAASRIVVHWYGFDNPAADNATDAGRARNRRVEIAVGGLDALE